MVLQITTLGRGGVFVRSWVLSCSRQAFSTEVEEKGRIAGVKPMKVKLEADKPYKWCACGHSKLQPFCDGSHVKVNEDTGSNFSPKIFEFSKAKEYYLCVCKQTAKRPLCDGTHNKKEVREAAKAQEAK